MASVNHYDLGSLVTVSAAFVTSAGAAYDPTTVICQIKDPRGTTVTYVYGTDAALVKDSVGHYHVDVDGNLVGEWHRRFHSTGTGQAADEGGFTIDGSEF